MLLDLAESTDMKHKQTLDSIVGYEGQEQLQNFLGYLSETWTHTQPTPNKIEMPKLAWYTTYGVAKSLGRLQC